MLADRDADKYLVHDGSRQMHALQETNSIPSLAIAGDANCLYKIGGPDWRGLNCLEFSLHGFVVWVFRFQKTEKLLLKKKKRNRFNSKFLHSLRIRTLGSQAKCAIAHWDDRMR